MLSEKILLELVKLQLVLILPVISDPNPIAEPKSFTDDPYVDDEKFREKYIELCAKLSSCSRNGHELTVFLDFLPC